MIEGSVPPANSKRAELQMYSSQNYIRIIK